MAIPSFGKPIIPALNLTRLTDNELDGYAQEKIDKLTGNPSFPDLPSFPEEQVMMEALNAYRISLAKADDGNSIDVEDKDVKRTLLENALTALAIRCAQIASGDLVIFHSSGFETRKPKEPPHLLPAPENLMASGGIVEQSVDLEWEHVEGSKAYVVQITETPQNYSTWGIVSPVNGGIVTRSNTSINGLVSGKKYWFRVAALNASGLSPYSEPADRIPQ